MNLPPKVLFVNCDVRKEEKTHRNAWFSETNWISLIGEISGIPFLFTL